MRDVATSAVLETYHTTHPQSSPENDVKQRSGDQREALPGEPKCIVCGRYGEYICDETDDDVCSMECKQALLCRIANAKLPVNTIPTKKIPANDECFYVIDAGGQSRSLSLAIERSDALRRKLDIHVRGSLEIEPILSFNSFNLPDRLLHNIEAAGYEIPTPVQMQAIPAALKGKSVLVTADTGSGKSASFLVPVISHCTKFRIDGIYDQRRPLAVILTPTRELAIQIEEHAKLLGKGLPFKTALVIGGDAMAGQLYRIQQGVELVVGTPGRLIDILAKHNVELDDVMIFVVDEVDCMLQRGFRDQVMQVFRAVPQSQVMMYSATISPDIEKMANSMKSDMVFISVGKSNRPSRAVKQLAIWVETKQKKQKLFDILMSKKHFMPPSVVFVDSKLGADLLANAVTVATGIKALSLHGEKPMKERREIMRSFILGEVPVIISTGVLSRGVDLLGVRQVIIFDMPNSIKEYVHQVGRASRMGEEGQAIVFVNEENKNLFTDLVEILRSAGAVVPQELLNSKYTTGFFSGSRIQKKRKHRC